MKPVSLKSEMTKHDYTKQQMRQLPNLSAEEQEKLVSVIRNFIQSTFTKPEYIIIMCKEIDYMTVFKIPKDCSVKETSKKILTFLQTDSFLREHPIRDFGTTKNSHVHIWMKDLYFALFPFDGFIVDLKEE